MDGSSLNIVVRQRGAVTLASLQGEYRLEPSETLTDKLRMAGADSSAKLVIDLTEVRFINSAALGELVQITAKANSQGGRVIIAGSSPFVAGVLETTHLNRFFEMAETVGAAMARLE